MVYIYVLSLEQNKYYVGKTDNISLRLIQHINENGSEWTKKYTPKNIIEVIPNCTDYDEDKYVIKYMTEHGINNVRGGTFSQIKLSTPHLLTLNSMLKTVTNACYICGSKTHYANKCKTIKDHQKEEINKELNKACKCVTSYLSPHRKKMCLLNKVICRVFEDEDDIIDDVFALFGGER
jgi:hypothetical protein